VNPIFTGDEPEFVDLLIREENGQLTGSLYARFKIPRGAARDPVLRFDFAGPVTSARTQMLALKTPDGAGGTLELIPGPATNLLEITWQLNASAPVKDLAQVRQGDVILVKK
jgi:hypothetical protein